MLGERAETTTFLPGDLVQLGDPIPEWPIPGTCILWVGCYTSDNGEHQDSHIACYMKQHDTALVIHVVTEPNPALFLLVGDRLGWKLSSRFKRVAR